jgi:hypothetical protein
VVAYPVPAGTSRDLHHIFPTRRYCTSQSRQNAKLFLLSLELGLPQPLTPGYVCPPPFGTGGRGTLAGERGGERVPIPTRGHTHCGTLYIYVLCVVHTRPSLPDLKYSSSLALNICTSLPQKKISCTTTPHMHGDLPCGTVLSSKVLLPL